MRTSRLLLLTLAIFAAIIGGSALLGWYERGSTARAIRVFFVMAEILPWLFGAATVIVIAAVVSAIVSERRKRERDKASHRDPP